MSEMTIRSILKTGTGILTLALLFGCGVGDANATFSIAAVDPVTGQVGSAGASCIAGSLILSDVHPGTGTIHTQAYWNSQNQQYARSLMNQGYAPEAIIDSLVAHDAGGNPTIRQYGIVDLVDGGRSAAYTGVNCTNYKGHITGPTYAIQGNILLGPQILEDMEQAFLDTQGPLADRLMAALQAAKVPGADTRCLSAGKSAISAFLRVANPDDPVNDLYCDLNVHSTSGSTDPIDVLQGLYDDWKITTDVAEGGAIDPSGGGAGGSGGDQVGSDGNAGQENGRGGSGIDFQLARPNPFRASTVLRYELPGESEVRLRVFDLAGRLVATLVDGRRTAGLHEVVWTGPIAGADRSGSGVYFCRLESDGETRTVKVLQLAP